MNRFAMFLTLVMSTLTIFAAACGPAPTGYGGPIAKVVAYVDSTDGLPDPILMWDASTSTDTNPGLTATFTWTPDTMPCFDIFMGVSSNGEKFGILMPNPPGCAGVFKATVKITDSEGRSDSASASLDYIPK